ncbi:MAG: TRAP transporter large permease [Rhodospirillales bacterium]|nr:TRAP transporter large permease [Rhodospirillales bacterium]MSP79680.1 TRAP transporter large permease [Rhodospirillales bacterium]
MLLLIMVLALFALVLINVPIAVALAVVTVVTMVITQGVDILPNVALIMYTGATKFPLIAIPLFILAGAIMNATGISRRLIGLASALLGFIRGGLAMVNVGASMFFAEISGSAVADVAAIGSILIPAMKKKGYPIEFSTAITSSAATLAVIIPPSIPMILYAVMADTSVTQMFVAGIIPGILGGFGLMGMAYGFARRYNYPVEEVFDLCNVWVRFKESAWALTMPFIILGGIFTGWVTATEGAGLAVLSALFIGLVIYRELDPKQLVKSVIEGGEQTAVVMLLVAASALIGGYLTEIKMPQALAQGITSFTDSKWVVLAILNVFFLIIGLFLHSAAAIILVVPIVMPLVLQMGIDPVHFGIIVTINLGIGQQTPPVASVLMAACAISKADIWEVTKVNVWFVAVLLAVLLLVTYVPIVALLPVEIFYR